MTTEGDLVLVHVENQPAFFARIEAIFADVKPHWFQVRMLVLQVPLVVITWILREPYINGEEFTMGGRPMRMEKVVAPDVADEEGGPPGSELSGERPAKEAREELRACPAPNAPAPADSNERPGQRRALLHRIQCSCTVLCALY
ncbi:MAG: hypothetical protein MUC41_14645 [Syntrophobacteraceae bacterium]|nr:hypothetical protein [Syntrophobacteraceae bacterium]